MELLAILGFFALAMLGVLRWMSFYSKIKDIARIAAFVLMLIICTIGIASEGARAEAIAAYALSFAFLFIPYAGALAPLAPLAVFSDFAILASCCAIFCLSDSREAVAIFAIPVSYGLAIRLNTGAFLFIDFNQSFLFAALCVSFTCAGIMAYWSAKKAIGITKGYLSW